MLARSNARDRVQKLHDLYTEPGVSIEEVRVLRWGNQGHGLKEAFASSLPSDGVSVIGIRNTSSRHLSSCLRSASLSNSQGSGSCSGVLFMAWVW